MRVQNQQKTLGQIKLEELHRLVRAYDMKVSAAVAEKDSERYKVRLYALRQNLEERAQTLGLELTNDISEEITRLEKMLPMDDYFHENRQEATILASEIEGARPSIELLESKIEKLTKELYWTELAVVALATLQSGYGDIVMQHVKGS